MQLFEELHPDWQRVLAPHKSLFEEISQKINPLTVTPNKELILRALTRPISEVKVVIFGQDPYPTPGHAHGLAFSVDEKVSPLPASLRNIFEELADDLGTAKRTQGDLSDWLDQGVMLLNRILSTESGTSLAHSKFGWELITDAVAQELGKKGVVGIFWGKSAGELKKHFQQEFIIESAHPSPLAAYRGFFGSKPFSSCNEILRRNGLDPIKWN